MNSMTNLTLLAAQSGLNEIPSGQWWAVVGTSVALLAGLAFFSYGTRPGIIARAATKEAVRQPIFALLLAIGVIVLLLNTFLPFFSLGEDAKMLKDCGLATMLFFSLLLAVWTASTGIADEIEGKTAMTLLSKPINRRQFVIGKYVGILQAILFLMIPLGLCLLALIYYKLNYDARESSKEALDGITSFQDAKDFAVGIVRAPAATFARFPRVAETVQVIPGLLLIFLEAAVLSAVSVAIATRLPMVVNLVICASIFVIGHLTPVLVQSTTVTGKLEFVKFTAQLVATILPNLEVFNINAAVATGSMVPPAYLGTALGYCVAYSTAAILLAFILFEDRDLA